MPWQRHVVDVALEIDPLTGLLAYDEVGLTVPRQSGKSTLILAKAVHRASATGFFGHRQRIVYTAQTRNKAREKWEEDYVADLRGSSTFRGKIRAHFGNGNEHIRFANGSRFGIEANTEKAGHGSTLDEAYIDEAFSQPDNRLEQAFRPAMITRHNTQLFWVSTAGWRDKSPYLLGKVERGRDHTEMGIREGLAYFEWSAPEDAEVDDRDAWHSSMPALGYTITEAAIEAELRSLDDNLNDFRRAYMNQWVLKDDPNTDTVVDLGVWAQLEDVGEDRPKPVAFSVEVSADRKWASIGLAGGRADSSTHVQIVQAGRGTGWVPERLVELKARWKPVAVAIRPSSPAGSLIPAVEAAGIDVVKVGSQEYAQACGLFTDSVGDLAVHHLNQPQVNKSLAVARRIKSSGAFAFATSDPKVDIAPLSAIVVALHALGRGDKKPKRSGLVQGIR